MYIEFNEMREKELKLFIIEFNRASQLDRSFAKTKLTIKGKRRFRKQLLQSCLHLMPKIDDGSITNTKIRNEIKRLKGVAKNISFGQAQKVINVCLKQYCFILNKNKLFKELDCPLDSTTMNGCKIKNNKMNNVTEKDYLQYQKAFEEKSCRILIDSEYDDKRITQFLKATNI